MLKEIKKNVKLLKASLLYIAIVLLVLAFAAGMLAIFSQKSISSEMNKMAEIKTSSLSPMVSAANTTSNFNTRFLTPADFNSELRGLVINNNANPAYADPESYYSDFAAIGGVSLNRAWINVKTEITGSKAGNTYRYYVEPVEYSNIDRLLAMGRKYNFKIVLTLEIPQAVQVSATESGIFWSNTQAQDAFANLWKDIATRYVNAPEVAGYDLLNEPVIAMPSSEVTAVWERVAKNAISKIREVDNNHVIIMEVAVGQSALSLDYDSFNYLIPNTQDSKIVYSIHMYSPMEFTHQGIYGNSLGVYWPTASGTTPTRFNENFNITWMRAVLDPVFRWQARYNLPIYVGEFSAIRYAPGESRVNYLRDFFKIMKENNWSWSYLAWRSWPGWDAEIPANNVPVRDWDPAENVRTGTGPTIDLLKANLNGTYWSTPVAPTVNISATPSSVPSGSTSIISWSSTNATSCTSSWGNVSTQGTFTTPSLTTNTTYTITCTGSGGSKTGSVTVSVQSIPAPTLTISASPASIAYLGKSTISWTSARANTCNYTYAISDINALGKSNVSTNQLVIPTPAPTPIPTSGSFLTDALTNNTSYTISCDGAGGSVAASVIVNVGAAPIPDPTVTITATPTSITYNTKSTISWSSTNANSCTNSWSNTTGTSGTYTTPNLTTNTTYTVTCTNAGGSKAASVIVNVGANPIPDPTPLPTITLTATPTSIAYNTKSTLTWSTTNAASCTSTWGNLGTEGSYTTPNLTTNTTYTLTCKNTANETKSSSVIINVASAPTPDPSVTITASPSSIVYLETSTLSWSSTNANSCTSSWGNVSTQGTYTTPNLSTTTIYTITCTGAGGEKSSSVIVNVTPQAQSPSTTTNNNNSNTFPPIITLTAYPYSVTSGNTTRLTWSSTNASTCNTSWGNNSTYGIYNTPPLYSDTTYTITCQGNGGTRSYTLTILVLPANTTNTTYTPQVTNTPSSQTPTYAISPTIKPKPNTTNTDNKDVKVVAGLKPIDVGEGERVGTSTNEHLILKITQFLKNFILSILNNNI